MLINPMNRRESSDLYHTVIERTETFRVIPCRDNLQWIIQRRSPKVVAEPRWRSISYCTTRESLIRLWTEKTNGSTSNLEKLPSQISTRAKWRHEDRNPCYTRNRDANRVKPLGGK